MLDEAKVFEYLDGLRESGAVNMFGAAPWIVQTFGVSKPQAQDLLLKWMENFDERTD